MTAKSRPKLRLCVWLEKLSFQQYWYPDLAAGLAIPMASTETVVVALCLMAASAFAMLFKDIITTPSQTGLFGSHCFGNSILPRKQLPTCGDWIPFLT